MVINVIKLKQWIKENNRLPSGSSKNPEEKKLGKYCSTQRQNKKKGILTDEDIRKLEMIDHWYWNFDDPFYKNYDELINWINTHKKMPNRVSEDEKEKKLGIFCDDIKQRKKKGKLSQEKIEKVNEIIGWIWEKNGFNEMCIALKEWMESHKRLPSSTSKNDKERKLGCFCSQKRKYKRQNKLSINQITKLEQIDGWVWDITFGSC